MDGWGYVGRRPCGCVATAVLAEDPVLVMEMLRDGLIVTRVDTHRTPVWAEKCTAHERVA